MPVENSTPNRGYLLPHATNDLIDDVIRLIAALTGIDLDVATILTAVAGKAAAAHGHIIADTTGLQAAIDSKQDLDEKGQANGFASLDASGKVPTSQLPAAVLGAMSYQSGWNASTNTPTIPAASAANKGHFYKVSTAGSTNVSGVTDWQVGDWIVSNGASWDKIDNTDQVMSVAGLMGAIPAAALVAALAAETFTLVQPNLTLKQSANPVPTAEGDAQWDTDDNVLVIGDGAGRKIFAALPSSADAGDVLYLSSAKAFARIAKGTAGQVLRMNPGATAPEWGAGNSSDYKEFLVSGTWTKPVGLSDDALVMIELWAGGGGGGAYGGGGAAAGGGGGGGYNTAVFRAGDLSATVSVTIGAGGGIGANGGNSSFGSFLTAYGGGTGGWSSGSTPGGGGGGGGIVSRGGGGGNNSAGAAGGGSGTAAAPSSADTIGKGGAGGGPNGGGGSATMYGGGGGAGGTPANGLLAGGHSVFGGGGGAAGFTQNGGMGTSQRGGNGGGVNNLPPPQVPGGGGGANGGVGAAGKCIVRVVG